MRIISKEGSDYYDNIMGYDSDNSKIYTRKPYEVEGKFYVLSDIGWRSWMKTEVENYPRISIQTRSASDGWIWHNVADIYVIFAGKLYGGINYNNTYYWKWEDVEDLKHIFNPAGRYEQNKTEHIKKILSIKGDPIMLEWAIERGVKVAVSTLNINYPKIITYDPLLRKIDFQKVLDPYTAYQELDQYLGGMLPENKPIPEPSDKEKVAIHGFSKWSFRKHKDDNK